MIFIQHDDTETQQGAAERERMRRPPPDVTRTIALAQGVMYVVTGMWPLVDARTFQSVTGPKVDFWLVRTVGVLITVIGIALTLAGVRRRVSAETRVLGAGSAVGLAAIDIVYSAKGRISKVYLLDAVVEIGIALAWLGLPALERATQRAERRNEEHTVKES